MAKIPLNDMIIQNIKESPRDQFMYYFPDNYKTVRPLFVKV